MNTFAYSNNHNMWTLLRFERNRAGGFYAHSGRGRVTHHAHHHAHHRRAARHAVHPQDPLVGCCNPTDRIVTCGTVSIAIGILTVIYATYEMYKAGEFYDNNKLEMVDTVLTPIEPPTPPPPFNGRTVVPTAPPNSSQPSVAPPSDWSTTAIFPSNSNSTETASDMPVNATGTVYTSRSVNNFTIQNSTPTEDPDTLLNSATTSKHLNTTTSPNAPTTQNGSFSSTSNSSIAIPTTSLAPPSALPRHQTTTIAVMKTTPRKYEDKYGAKITQEKFEYLMKQEKLDKGLCVSLTFLGIIQVVASGILIRGAKLRDKRSFIPWMIIISSLMVLGLVYVLFNIVTLDFNASVNFVLFLWILACVIEFHCLKSVLRVYKGRDSENRFREGTAVFDPRLGNEVFTITNGHMSQAESPVRIILKPPSYEEAMTALDDLGPPPDPPDEEEGKDIDNPPEYTP